jgi:thioredoxin reductase (NADPH)
MKNSFDVIVIGGGIGGSAAALRAAQNNMTTLFITGSKASRKRSRSQWVLNVDNMIGFHEGVIKDQILADLGRDGHQKAAASITERHYHINNRMLIRNTLERLRSDYSSTVTVLEQDCQVVQRVDGRFIVQTGDSTHQASAVVLATGIMDEQPLIPVHDKAGNISESPRPIYPFANRETVLYCIRCEGHLTRNDAVAVIGHSNTAAEVACMLHERYRNTVFLLANGIETAFSDRNHSLCTTYHIEIIPDPITEFVSEGVGQLCAVSFSGHPMIEVKFAFASLGTHRVYNDLAQQVGAELLDLELPPEKRQIAINHKGETSVPNFFAVGDAARRSDEPTMKQIYTAQEYAVRAVDTIDYRQRREIRKQALAG